MANSYKIIDKKKWERATHCMIFRNCATPLFDWGKYYEKDGKIVIPISVQAHHSFVDGIHVGKFADALQNYFDVCQ